MHNNLCTERSFRTIYPKFGISKPEEKKLTVHRKFFDGLEKYIGI